MRPSSLPSLFVALLLVSGCALIPDLGDKPQMQSALAVDAIARDNAAKWPAADWWTAYGDLQLNTLIGEAFAQSPDLAAASARIRRADAATEQSDASLFPTLTARGEMPKVKQSYNNGIPPAFVPKGFQFAPRATLNFSYELDFWGRNRKLVEAATSQADAARLEAEQAKLLLATNIANGYAQLAQLYAELDTAEEAAVVRGKTASLFDERLKQGLENKGSYDQVLAAQESAQADVEALKEAIQLNKNALAALMGSGPDRAVMIDRPMITLQSRGVPADLPANLLGRRPDIQAARLRAQALAAQIDVAQTAFYPDVNLTGYLGRQSLHLDMFDKEGSMIGSFGPAISLPLFEGGRLQGQYRAARADYDAGVAEYNRTLTQALREVADTATSQRALQARTERTEAAMAAAERAYAVTQNRYRGGLATYLEVLRAEDTLISNRRALADIHARAFTLDVALVKALGGGFVIPEKQDEKHDSK